MSEKLPQPTPVLIKRLRRVAKWLDEGQADSLYCSSQEKAANRARANTCWQCAARLEELDAPRAGYEAFSAAVDKTQAYPAICRAVDESQSIGFAKENA